MKPIRTLAAALALCLAAAQAAHAYPDKPIRLVVPAAPGGSTDQGARLVAEMMSKELGAAVIVENRGGAGGRVGAAYAAGAPADGYTLLFGSSITNALIPAVSRQPGYDAPAAFVPVGQAFWYSTIVACHPGAPFDTFRELIDHGKRHPGELVMATAGIGSGNHFSSALIDAMAGIEHLYVPYQGNTPAVQDVLAGRATCIHMTEVQPYLESGRLKAIATTGIKRDPRFPEVPTVDESGLAGYDLTWWQAVFAPAGTAPEVIDVLARALERVVSDPVLVRRAGPAGFNPEYVAGAALQDKMRRDREKFARIARDAAIELD